MIENADPYLADFGVAATLANTAVLRGFFDRRYAEGIDGLAASASPVFALPDASAAALARGDTLTIGGATFSIVSIEPDGTGWTLLVLRR